jgi:DNA-binding HxlR family transcriptional regulator
MTALPKRAIRLTPKVVAAPGASTNGVPAPTLTVAPSTSNPTFLSPSCPAQAAIEVVAAKWSLKILHRLTKGKARFNSLQRDLPGVSQKVLTQQLRKLEKHGLITRTVHTTVPPSVEYALTPAGAELKTALKDLHEWAKKYIKMNWADGKDC